MLFLRLPARTLGPAKRHDHPTPHTGLASHKVQLQTPAPIDSILRLCTLRRAWEAVGTDIITDMFFLLADGRLLLCRRPGALDEPRRVESRHKITQAHVGTRETTDAQPLEAGPVRLSTRSARPASSWSPSLSCRGSGRCRRSAGRQRPRRRRCRQSPPCQAPPPPRHRWCRQRCHRP